MSAATANTLRVAQAGPALLTVEQAAQRLGVATSTLRDYLTQGILPCVVLPPRAGHSGTGKTARRRIVRVHTEDLNAFMHACRVAGEAASSVSPFEGGARRAGDVLPPQPESLGEIIARLGEEYCPAT